MEYSDTSADIKVRLAKLSDCKDITSVHCSGIRRWVRHVGSEEVEDDYKNLTVLDRYLMGGPWMSLETCISYISFLLSSGQYPSVAEIDREIVGEIEVFIGEEPLPLGKNASISVLEVAKTHRRKGVGRALVDAATKLAEEQECCVIVTSPEQNAVGFYRKCGLNRVLMELKNIEVDLHAVSADRVDSVQISSFDSFDQLREMHMILGRWDSSFSQWFKRRWKFDLWSPSMMIEEGFIPVCDAAYRIESSPLDNSICNLLAWIRNKSDSQKAFGACIRRAKRLGFKKLRTIGSEELLSKVRLPFSAKGSEIVLARKLADENS
jgi:ribosomal protein S18 acetylase RimI-like enzyme